MIATMDIFKVVPSLHLPEGKYAVFGSGPLAAHGIRDSRDIDIIITSDVYDWASKLGWQEKSFSDGTLYLAKDGVELFDSWDYGAYNPTAEELIEKAEIIRRVPFVPLSEVLKWKQAFGRPKDLDDIKLIEQHLLRSS